MYDVIEQQIERFRCGETTSKLCNVSSSNGPCDVLNCGSNMDAMYDVIVYVKHQRNGAIFPQLMDHVTCHMLQRYIVSTKDMMYDVTEQQIERFKCSETPSKQGNISSSNGPCDVSHIVEIQCINDRYDVSSTNMCLEQQHIFKC